MKFRLLLAAAAGSLLAVLCAAGPAHARLCLSFDSSAEDFTRRWSVEAGVAKITQNTIAAILRGEIHFDGGMRGGEIYHLGASYLLGEAVLDIGEREFRPQLEAPVFLEIFDENERSPFLSYNAALRLRWVDFPWNDTVRTTFAYGAGFSYSEKIPRMEYKRSLRNKDERRTHLKFTMPADISFAHPRWPEHQVMIFLSHQSAGRIFGRGGLNALGVGYRWGFK